MGAAHSLEDDLIDFRMTSKSMARSALKCEKNQKINKDKAQKAMAQGNIDGARIYGQNVIREKNQALNYLRLQSRIDAVSSRLETAIRMKEVSKAMGTTVKGMSAVMKSMDVDKISSVRKTHY
jgi:charged multivesicular body protein 1